MVRPKPALQVGLTHYSIAAALQQSALQENRGASCPLFSLFLISPLEVTAIRRLTGEERASLVRSFLLYNSTNQTVAVAPRTRRNVFLVVVVILTQPHKMVVTRATANEPSPLVRSRLLDLRQSRQILFTIGTVYSSTRFLICLDPRT